MKKTIIYGTFLCAGLSAFLMACSDDPAPSGATIVKEWTVPLSTKNENPAPVGRTETGTVTIRLLSDNTLSYNIAINGLAAGDALVAAHIHTGDVITNGPVIQNFSPTFSGSTATGTVTGLRSTFIDSLKTATTELYFNVHSTQFPGGLARGQMNTNLEMVADVVLSGANEVPAVTTTATGIALIRMTSDKKLYSKVTVTNVEAGDALTAAHIHAAATGVNGSVILGLCGSAADFGVAKIFTVSDVLFASIKADPIYVNAHTVIHPGGIIRGQIR